MPKKKKILTLDEHFEFVRMLLPLARKMREAEHKFRKLAYDMEDKWLADGIRRRKSTASFTTRSIVPKRMSWKDMTRRRRRNDKA